MELYRNGLKLTATIGLDESRGSVNVPVRLLHNKKDKYLNYTEQIHIRYLFDNQVKEEILPTNDNGFYIPGKPLSHDGPIELAVHLINGDIELVTNELSFVVKNAPNGTTQVDPSEFTWQQLVDQYVNAKLDTFANKLDLSKFEETVNGSIENQSQNIESFKTEVNANLFNQDKKITDLQNTTKVSLDSQNTKIDNFKSEVNTSLSNQNTSINQTTSAQNSKITTLESRMDTFTRLSEGSTTGDAELQDIRVGANGITYDTAGNAVRGQYSQLKEDIIDVTNVCINNFNIEKTYTQSADKKYNNIYFKAGTKYIFKSLKNISVYLSSEPVYTEKSITLMENSCGVAIVTPDRDMHSMYIYTSESNETDVLTITSVVNTNDNNVVLDSYTPDSVDKYSFPVAMFKGISYRIFTGGRYGNVNVTYADGSEEQLEPSKHTHNIKVTPSKDITKITLWFGTTSDVPCHIKVVKNDYVEPTEILTPSWRLLEFTENGEYKNSANSTNSSACTQTILGAGLYLISFPNTLKVICNCVVNGARSNFTSRHPVSFFSDDVFICSFYELDGTPISVSDNRLNDVIIYRVNSSSDKYDVVFAAQDSQTEKKTRADIVCDGRIDTKILASAFGCFNNISALLLEGNYNITEYWKPSDKAYSSLTFNTNTPWNYIDIEGEESTSTRSDSGTYLRVSKSLHESFPSSGINNFIISSPRDYDWDISTSSRNHVILKNFNLIGYGVEKPISYIDTTRCDSTMIDCVCVIGWKEKEYTALIESPNEKSVGIRVGQGSNGGIQNFVKHSKVWYCGTGVSICGEHYIIEDVKSHHCLVGFAFGDLKTVPKQEHPNIMIGCSIESCKRYMTLSKQGITTDQNYVRDDENGIVRSTLIVIGMSTENTWYIPTSEQGESTTQHTLPIHEYIKGCWMGRIEIDEWVRVTEENSGSKIVITRYSPDGNIYNY